MNEDNVNKFTSFFHIYYLILGIRYWWRQWLHQNNTNCKINIFFLNVNNSIFSRYMNQTKKKLATQLRVSVTWEVNG